MALEARLTRLEREVEWLKKPGERLEAAAGGEGVATAPVACQDEAAVLRTGRCSAACQ